MAYMTKLVSLGIADILFIELTEQKLFYFDLCYLFFMFKYI